MLIDPVILELGPLQIRWYGLVYVFGMLLVYRSLKKNKAKLGMESRHIDDFLLYLMLGMLIGARLFHFLFSDPRIFISDPLELVRIWHGGMSFFGGLAGACLGSYLFTRKHKVSFLALGDTIVIPVAFTLAIGRIANFINDELVGTITSVPWCVNFPEISGCRHPYPLYASLSHFALAGILLFLHKKRKLKTGMLFLSFLFLYGLFRFTTDFWRDDPRMFGLTVWQALSMVLMAGSGIVLYMNRETLRFSHAKRK